MYTVKTKEIQTLLLYVTYKNLLLCRTIEEKNTTQKTLIYSRILI